MDWLFQLMTPNQRLVGALLCVAVAGVLAWLSTRSREQER